MVWHGEAWCGADQAKKQAPHHASPCHTMRYKFRLSLTKYHILTLLKPAFWQGRHHSIAFIALKQDLHCQSFTM